MDPNALRRWKTAALVSALVIVVAIPLSRLRPRIGAGTAPSAETAPATFVGTSVCKDCHKAAYEKWKGSDHERAMDVATDATVLGDFNDARFTDRGVTSRFYRRGGKFLVE